MFSAYNSLASLLELSMPIEGSSKKSDWQLAGAFPNRTRNAHCDDPGENETGVLLPPKLCIKFVWLHPDTKAMDTPLISVLMKHNKRKIDDGNIAIADISR